MLKSRKEALIFVIDVKTFYLPFCSFFFYMIVFCTRCCCSRSCLWCLLIPIIVYPFSIACKARLPPILPNPIIPTVVFIMLIVLFVVVSSCYCISLSYLVSECYATKKMYSHDLSFALPLLLLALINPPTIRIPGAQ